VGHEYLPANPAYHRTRSSQQPEEIKGKPVTITLKTGEIVSMTKTTWKYQTSKQKRDLYTNVNYIKLNKQDYEINSPCCLKKPKTSSLHFALIFFCFSKRGNGSTHFASASYFMLSILYAIYTLCYLY
jgi:hypothetical protein